MKIDATETAALIALAGVFTSAMVAYVTASRSVYVNAITSARIRWLESISEKLVDFQNMHFEIAVYTSKKTESEEVDVERIKSLYRVFLTIMMQLNRKSRNEDNIIRLMKLCSNSLADYKKTTNYNKLLVDHSHWLLKSEWKKIKAEAGSLLAWPMSRQEAWKRARAYERFCRGDGKID